MKKWLARIIIVSLFVLPALVLFGCGDKQEDVSAEEPAAQEVAETQEGLFEGREARDISEMKPYKEKALENAEQCRAVHYEDKEEAELTVESAEDFEEANAQYKEGDYRQAQKGYEKILKAYPLHYGANVNLTLALLQQEKNEEALVQALCSLSLFPTDDGIPLNVQTAAVASGFLADDALEIGDEVISESDGGSEVATKREHELAYNRLWDRVETELWKAAHGKGSDKQNREAYEALHKELSEMMDSGELSDDKDAQALLAYLEAAGEQLGLTTQEKDADEAKEDASTEEAAEEKEAAEDEAAKKDDADAKDTEAAKDDAAKKDSADDKDAKDTADAKKPSIDFSTVEPHVGLPYVVMDDELCTIIFTGYHMGSEHPVAEFALLNKTSDKRLRMEAEDARANGIDVEDFSGAWVSADPGEQATAWGLFFGMDGEHVVSLVKEELKELTCTISVADATNWPYEDLGTYPFSWKEEESGEGRMSIDQKKKKKAIDEEGVYSLTVTDVRGTSDDFVGIGYDSWYKGEGNISFDSKDDFKVNGVDMEVVGAGMPFDNQNGLCHVLLLKAKNPGALGNAPLETVEGTLIVKDADGKEIASGKIELP